MCTINIGMMFKCIFNTYRFISMYIVASISLFPRLDIGGVAGMVPQIAPAFGGWLPGPQTGPRCGIGDGVRVSDEDQSCFDQAVQTCLIQACNCCISGTPRGVLNSSAILDPWQKCSTKDLQLVNDPSHSRHSPVHVGRLGRSLVPVLDGGHRRGRQRHASHHRAGAGDDRPVHPVHPMKPTK